MLVAASLTFAQPDATALEWAQFNASSTPSNENEKAWIDYWRNRAGQIASQMVAANAGGAVQEPAPAPAAPPPQPPVDVNAAFRAAATPEENLSRAPAPKINTESSYVPKPRDGEAIGIGVDYAKIESMIHRYADEPTSTVPMLPPVPMWGASQWYGGYSAGWGGGGWGSRQPWGGPSYCSPPILNNYWASPSVLACPVVYNPYYCNGLTGGFFYGNRHVAVGVRF